MASFTEQATLKVVDQSTAQINKINAALKKLFATARSLKSASINIKVNASGIQKTLTGLRKLNAEAKKGTVVRQLSAAAAIPKQITKNIKPATQAVKQLGAATTTSSRQVTAGVNRISQAQQQHNAHVVAAVAYQKQLQQQQRRTQSGVPRMPLQRPAQPWGAPRRAAGGGGRPAGPGGPTRPGGRTGGGGYGRTPGGAFLGGFGGGIGIGLGRLNESFGLVALAGYAAASALRAVAEAAQKRDRAELSVIGQTSPAQREVFDQLDKEAKARGDLPPALRYKTDDFKTARSSFLGDVGNADIIDPKTGKARQRTPKELATPEAQRERAVRSDILARKLFSDVVPGMYARNPKLTAGDAQQELLKLVQTLGITTDKMFGGKDSTGRERGTNELSEAADRVLKGIDLAQRAAPDLTLGQIKTAAASIKSLGYTATPEQIAEVLYNVSAKGQRAAGEAYQMYKTGLGTTDVGKLNYAINQLGGFIEGTAKPGKKKGTIQAGTGIPRDFADPDDPTKRITLAERPSEWWRRLLAEGPAQKKFADDVATQAAGRETDPKKKKAAAAAARKRVQEGQATDAEQADFVNRTLTGARSTALQGILDAWLGGAIAKAGLAQAAGTPGPREIEAEMAQRWSVAAENLGTTMSNAAATTGQFIANMINLNGILSGLSNWISNNELAAGAIGATVAVAIGAAVVVPFARLVTAANALIGAAAALKGGAIPGTVPPGGPPGGKPPTPPRKGGKLGGLGAGMVLGSKVVGRAIPYVGWGLLAWDIWDLVEPYISSPEKTDQDKLVREAEIGKQKDAQQMLLDSIQRQLKAQEGKPQTEEGKAKVAELQGKLAEVQRKLAVLEAANQPAVTPTDVTPTETPAQTQAAIQANIDKAIKDHTKANPPKAVPVPLPVMPDVAAITKQVISDLEKSSPGASQEVINNAVTAAVIREMGKQQQQQAKPGAAASPAKSIAAGATPPPVAPDSLAALIPQLAATANSITVAVSGLTTAGSTFATAFSAGATAIGTAGQTAVNTLNGAAPGIGAAIGNAAANAIKSATANISVNVNAPSSSAPKGDSKAAN